LIPAGSEVAMSSYVVHHSPKYWENPEGFDPDRFTEAAQKIVHLLLISPLAVGHQRISYAKQIAKFRERVEPVEKSSILKYNFPVCNKKRLIQAFLFDHLSKRSAVPARTGESANEVRAAWWMFLFMW